MSLLLAGPDLPKYTSVDTDIGCYDASLLESEDRLVYKQWEMDENDDKLIDGYYTECDLTPIRLSPDLKKIIRSFYMKKYSKGKLKGRFLEILRRKKYQNQLKKEKLLTAVSYACICCVILFIFAFMFGADIAGLILINNTDCDVAMDDKTSSIHVDIGINQFLFIGSITHIVVLAVFACIALFIFYQYYDGNCDDLIVLLTAIILGCLMCCFVLFFVAWSIVGSILYSQMNVNDNKQCSKMVLSWVILKFIVYGGIICIAHLYSQTDSFRQMIDDM